MKKRLLAMLTSAVLIVANTATVFAADGMDVEVADYVALSDEFANFDVTGGIEGTVTEQETQQLLASFKELDAQREEDVTLATDNTEEAEAEVPNYLVTRAQAASNLSRIKTYLLSNGTRDDDGAYYIVEQVSLDSGKLNTLLAYESVDDRIAVFAQVVLSNAAKSELDCLFYMDIDSGTVWDDYYEVKTYPLGSAKTTNPVYHGYTYDFTTSYNKETLSFNKKSFKNPGGFSEANMREQCNSSVSIAISALDHILITKFKLRAGDVGFVNSPCYGDSGSGNGGNGGDGGNNSNTELRSEDGKLKYYENGVFTPASGFRSVGGIKYLIVNGEYVSSISGLYNDPEHPADWYYLSEGRAQTQYTGLAYYDGAWFYVNKGLMDSTIGGIVEYDGGLFYVAVGRIVNELSGLAQDPKTQKWYFLANGQVQNQYTGLAQYDGAWFYVIKGALASDYIGEVEYNGAKFFVVNGGLGDKSQYYITKDLGNGIVIDQKKTFNTDHSCKVTLQDAAIVYWGSTNFKLTWNVTGEGTYTYRGLPFIKYKVVAYSADGIMLDDKSCIIESPEKAESNYGYFPRNTAYIKFEGWY